SSPPSRTSGVTPCHAPSDFTPPPARSHYSGSLPHSERHYESTGDDTPDHRRGRLSPRTGTSRARPKRLNRGALSAAAGRPTPRGTTLANATRAVHDIVVK